MNGQCHCGAVQICIAHKPDYLNDCNCSLCTKTGALWIYFQTAEVDVIGKTKSYMRADKTEAVVQLHFCPSCGSSTHWKLSDSYDGEIDRMGVNMHLFDTDILTGIELRFPDGKAWNGEGEYNYARAPVNFGDNNT